MVFAIMSYHRYMEETRQQIAEQRWEEIQWYETWRIQRDPSAKPMNISHTRLWLDTELLLSLKEPCESKEPCVSKEPYEDVINTFIRLYGITTPTDWGRFFHGLVSVPPLSMIRWLIEEKGVVIDWNVARYRSFLLLMYYTLQGEEGDAYLVYLFNNGANPALLLEDRDPLFLRWMTMELTTTVGRRNHSESLRRAELLLRYGADPLLTNDQGGNALDLIREAHLFTTITQEEQADWITLLERYA